MSSKQNPIAITKLAAEKLSPRILEAIDKIEIERRTIIIIANGQVKFCFQGQLSLKKWLVFLGSAISTLALLVKYWAELHQIFTSLFT